MHLPNAIDPLRGLYLFHSHIWIWPMEPTKQMGTQNLMDVANS